jgi:hypothetical protein
MAEEGGKGPIHLVDTALACPFVATASDHELVSLSCWLTVFDRRHSGRYLRPTSCAREAIEDAGKLVW